MSSNPVDVRVEGKQSAEEQVTEKYEKDIVLEQASQMDMELLRAAEVNRESRDIATPPQPQLIAEAEKIAKKYPTDKQRATLEKARAAKAEKRKLNMMNGRAGAQGTPAPDLITQVSELLNSKFESVNQILDDIKKYIPYEAPTQTNHSVPMAPEKQVSLPTNPETYQVQNSGTDNKVAFTIAPDSSTGMKRARSPSPVRLTPVDNSYPLRDRYTTQQMNRDQRNNKRRFTQALSSIDFTNEDVMHRAKINFNEMGGHEPPKTGFYF